MMDIGRKMMENQSINTWDNWSKGEYTYSMKITQDKSIYKFLRSTVNVINDVKYL